MKTTALFIAALLFTACSKEDKSIRYEVDCTSCAIEYVRGDAWAYTYAQGAPILDTVFATFPDTGIVRIDTTGYELTSWAVEFDEAEDFAPGLKSRVKPGNSTTGRIFVDGVKTKEGSTSTYGEEVSL